MAPSRFDRARTFGSPGSNTAGFRGPVGANGVIGVKESDFNAAKRARETAHAAS
jgi:hypothetical protein